MRRAAAALALLLVAGCGGASDEESPTTGSSRGMRLESPAFRQGGELPARFTCDGKGISPPLRWSGVPEAAQDLALMVEDPDVPVGAFVHWAIWRMPVEPDGSGRVLEGDVAPELDQGLNDFGDRGWGPACPRKGEPPHRYVFTLYAVDRVLDLPKGADAARVRTALTATGAIAQSRLQVTYARR